MQIHPTNGPTLLQDLTTTPEYVPYSAQLDFKTQSQGLHLQALNIRQKLNADARFKEYVDKKIGVTVLCLGKMPRIAYLWTDEGTFPCILHLPTTIFAVIQSHHQSIFDMAVDLTPRALLDKERHALSKEVDKHDREDTTAHTRLQNRKLELCRRSKWDAHLDVDETKQNEELKELEAKAYEAHLIALHTKQRWYLLDNASARRIMSTEDRRDENDLRRRLSDSMQPPRA
ncbi:MAG: hypothetical protein ABIO72_02985 [Patescibacteria group bacterium]